MMALLEDVENSVLLAQRAATAKYDRQTDLENWYTTYRRVNHHLNCRPCYLIDSRAVLEQCCPCISVPVCTQRPLRLHSIPKIPSAIPYSEFQLCGGGA
jgi:hypothetical protein